MESGWNHFQLREYDPVIGRWLVPDPYRQYASPYKAMGNNPGRNTDPDGGCNDENGNPCPTNLGLDGVDGLLLTEALELSSPIAYSDLEVRPDGFSNNSNITNDPIPALEKGRPRMGSVGNIILHRTVSSNYPGNWMKSRDKIKGAHFYVDRDGTVYQTASLNISTAHLYASSSKQMYSEYFQVLNNSNSVGIEVVGNYKGGQWEPLTARQAEATSILVTQLKNHYNIGLNNIYPHEKVQRKTPGEGQTVYDALNINYVPSWLQWRGN